MFYIEKIMTVIYFGLILSFEMDEFLFPPPTFISVLSFLHLFNIFEISFPYIIFSFIFI